MTTETRRDVSFEDHFSTYYTALGLLGTEDDAREAAAEEIQAQEDYLRAKIGRLKEYWCGSVAAAAWYGDRPLRIYHTINANPASPPELDALLDETSSLEEESRSLLQGPSLRRYLDVLWNTFTNGLDAYDRYAEGTTPPEMLDRLVISLRKYVRDDTTLLNSLAQRQAQFHYFYGMVIGAALLMGVAIVFALAAPVMPRIDVEMADIISGCIIGGSLGAIFSVLSRMHGGRLVLSIDAGKEMLRLLGAVRPVVGAVAGIALFLIIDGEALDILSKPEPSARPYSYYAALAFIAGFSERWFQDMLALGGGSGGQGTTAAASNAEPTPSQPSPTGLAASQRGLTDSSSTGGEKVKAHVPDSD